MRIDVLTLFPEVMQPYLTASILGRAQDAGAVEIHTHQLRDYTRDSHRKVDDRPYGGGPGMVLSCQPVCDAVEALRFSQATASRFASCERLFLICGHYEGYDERIIELLQPEEVSLGDFVMTGGEIAALAVIDSVVRLLPGALGNEEAADSESFQRGRLEYPQYTRPREFRGLSVPDVLLTGNHADIEAWRRSQSELRTQQRRPDLLDQNNCAAQRIA